MTGALLILLGLASWAAQTKDAEFRDEVTVRGKGSGPPVQVPQPGPEKAVVDEVIRSLDIYRSQGPLSPSAKLPGGPARLLRPFPRPPFLALSPRAVAVPYERWHFEVLRDGEVLWRTQGEGRLTEPLEWDGTGSSGGMVARAGESYRFRFSGKGRAPFSLVSEPVALQSLSYEEFSQESRLEVANAALFAKGAASFIPGSRDYLAHMAQRLRTAEVREGPYRFLLYQKEPKGKLARARAAALKAHFSKELLVHPDRIEVLALATGERGDATVCLLPAEK